LNGFLHANETNLSLVPEFVTETTLATREDGLDVNQLLLDHKYISIFNAAGDMKIPEEKYLTNSAQVPERRIDVYAVNTHFIYDPITDTTHCFLLPNLEKLVKE
jgi:hypothetical protein